MEKNLSDSPSNLSFQRLKGVVRIPLGKRERIFQKLLEANKGSTDRRL